MGEKWSEEGEGKNFVQIVMVRICQAGYLIQSPYSDDTAIAIGSLCCSYWSREISRPQHAGKFAAEIFRASSLIVTCHRYCRVFSSL